MGGDAGHGHGGGSGSSSAGSALRLTPKQLALGMFALLVVVWVATSGEAPADGGSGSMHAGAAGSTTVVEVSAEQDGGVHAGDGDSSPVSAVDASRLRDGSPIKRLHSRLQQRLDQRRREQQQQQQQQDGAANSASASAPGGKAPAAAEASSSSQDGRRRKTTPVDPEAAVAAFPAAAPIDFAGLADVARPPAQWQSAATYARIAADKATAAPVLVAVTTCCSLFNMTRRMMLNLALLADNIDVLVVDDASTDGSRELLQKLGLRVLPANAAQPDTPSGLTASWNTAWQWFQKHAGYRTLFLANNDILIDHGGFTRMDELLHRPANLGQPAIVGPLTSTRGLGWRSASFLKRQNADHNLFAGQKIPAAMLDSLPGSLRPLNRWLLERIDPEHAGVDTAWMLGFLLGLRRDTAIESSPGNLIHPALLNTGQEEDLFQRGRALVSHTTFVFHIKGGTMGEKSEYRDNLDKYHKEKHGNTAASIDPDRCEDLFPDYKCAEMARFGACKSSETWMWANCRKTCGLCPFQITSDCVDAREKCARWAGAGECEKNPKFMLAHCRKSCAMCPPRACVDEDSDCEERAAAGECDSKPGVMLDRCRKACHACDLSPMQLASVCTDLHANCAWWSSIGECVGGAMWLRQQCRLSCGVCDPSKKISEIDNYVCEDQRPTCAKFAAAGDCDSNREWMHKYCKQSCNVCPRRPSADCQDTLARCRYWAIQDQCEQPEHSAWMRQYCRRSCGCL